MKTIITLLLVSFLSIYGLFGQGDTLYQTVMHNGLERNYILYVPEAYDGSESWPLVFNFHGYAINAEAQMVFSNMNAVADTGHFLVIYPEGTLVNSRIPNTPPEGLGFNVSFPGDTVNFISINNVDDVAFTSFLIDHISESYRVDLAKIYSTGWSNGGIFSTVLACELSDRIAAIAPVGGTRIQLRTCPVTRKVPVLQIHGTQDSVVLYDGNPTDSLALSVDDYLDFWTLNNGCDQQAIIDSLPDLVTEDSSTVEVLTWQNCDEEVIHYRINGGGHNWPGGNNLFPFLGNFNLDINASSEIWNFFKRNPHPNPSGRLLERSFVHDDSLRSYLFYVPAAYDSSENWPLVINYHGFLSQPSDQIIISQMNSIADTGHFLIAYPQGLTVDNPNVGFSGIGWAVSGVVSENDDVGFTDELINQIDAEFEVDLSRVYATGWSLGGSMAYELACQLSNRIVAVAAVATQMGIPQLENCSPERAMSILQIHGTADSIVFFNGDGELFSPSINTPLFWAEQNNCALDSTVTQLPDIAESDSSTVTLYEWGNCDANTEVLFYQINNGGHNWPGGNNLFPFLGNFNLDINASSEIWNFFTRHTFSNVSTSIDPSLSIANGSVKVYPNPFQHSLTIELEAKQHTEVMLSLKNSLGQTVSQTTPYHLLPGSHQILWEMETEQLPNGLYFLVMEANNDLISKAILLQKL